jgi:DNA polymerase
MTTEEYINDPRFEVIGVGIKYDDLQPEWYAGDDVNSALYDLSCHASEHAILCHNTMFDGAILAWKYGVIPGMYFDTLSMARAVHGVDAGGSLKSLAERYNIGEKGDGAVNNIGKRRSDFTKEDLKSYGEYCTNDVALTYRLFERLQPFPNDELNLIDLTTRMYTQPQLKVDDALLVQRLVQVKADKSILLKSLMMYLQVDTEEEVRKKLASNPQFADLLRDLNVPIPMKISKTTGKEAPALAKTDEGFIALQDHEKPIVQQLCAVRLGTKSTIEESRIERFIGVGSRNRGYIPVPLRYYGAHTGRWSGLDSINFQNLPSRDKVKKTLKNSIVAPKGHILINSDSSQIEARILAWLSAQDDLVELFRKGEDVYSVFASTVYDRPISKADPVERFVGKTCILGLGYGTGSVKLQQTLSLGGAVLTVEECKRIVDLYRSKNDKVVALWRQCDTILQQMLNRYGNADIVGTCKELWSQPVYQQIRLPNNLHLRYPNLRIDDESKIVYDSRRGAVSIWGGALTENIVQALARLVVSHQMIRIAEQYRPALTVHDSIVCCVPENECEKALAFIGQVMSSSPDWAKGLPVACETKYGYSYGDC